MGSPSVLGGAIAGTDAGNGATTDETKVGTQQHNVRKERVTSPKIPDDYSDKTAISARIDKVVDLSRQIKVQFESDWYRNLLFYLNVQWIIEDRRGYWRARTLPTWFPRATTNKFAEKANDLTSAILQMGRVPITYLPATDDDEDQAVADMSETIRDALYEEAEIDEIDEELARWVVLTGSGFLIPHFDYDKEMGAKTLPQLQCNNCAPDPEEMQDPSKPQATGPDGQPAKLIAPEDAPDATCPDCQQPLSIATDQNGEQITQDYPIGRFASTCCSPFEIRADHRIRQWHKQREFVRLEMMDVDRAAEKYNLPEDTVVPDNANNDLGIFYLETMSQITSSYGQKSSLAGGFVSAGASRQPKTLIYHYYQLPTEDYKEGIHAVRVGTSSAQVVEAEPLTNVAQYGAGPRKGKPFLPLVHFGFDVAPGRAWNKSRMDDLISLQVFRNIIDANLRLTVQRMGNSIWMNPKGSGVNIFTGTPGQVIGYNPVSFGGTSFAKPERVPADLSGLAGLIALENKIDDAMERIAGTFFLSGGETPPGVTAASALAYLGERANRSMSTFSMSWAKSWKKWESFGLEIFRQHATQPRFVTIAGKNKQYEIKQFTKADLTGGVKMIIDTNGLTPKSSATQRATIAQLVQMQLINPTDPEMAYRVLEKFGETDLKPSMDLDVSEAQRENDRFMEENQAPVLIPLVQNALVHITEHADLCKTDEFKQLDPAAQQVMIKHIEAHMQEMQMQQALAQGATQQPPPVPGPNDGHNGEGAKGAKGDQGPNGTRKIQAPRPVAPEEQNSPDLLASAMEPKEPAFNQAR